MRINTVLLRFTSLAALTCVSFCARAATTAYISSCCTAPSVVSVFNTSNFSQSKQFLTGSDASSIVFAPDGLYVYVGSEDSETISIFETSTWTRVKTIEIARFVTSLAISPDGNTLYVQAQEDNGVIIAINIATGSVSNKLRLSCVANSSVVSPDGTRLYLSCNDSFLAIDAKSLTIVGIVPSLGGVSQALSADGKFAYVLAFSPMTSYGVAVIDTSTFAIVASIPLPTNFEPHQCATSPDGSLVYISETPLESLSFPRITVINTSTNSVVEPIELPFAANPETIVVSPDGSFAYVADSSLSSVDVVDLTRNQFARSVGTYGAVQDIALSPDGTTLAVPNSSDSQAFIVDASGTIEAQVTIGNLEGEVAAIHSGGAAVSPDGARVYFTNQFSNNISVLDTASRTVIANVYTGPEPIQIVISPDGSVVYVASSTGDSITAVNTNTFATDTIPLPHSGRPTSIAITPDGGYIYVTVGNLVPYLGFLPPGYLFQIDTKTRQVTRTGKLRYPMAVAVSPSGDQIYVVSDYQSTTLLTISPSTFEVTSVLILGGYFALQPATAGIVVSPDGSSIFVDDSTDNNVWKVNVSTNAVVADLSVGTQPGQLAITPDGTEVYVTDYQSHSVSVIDAVNAIVTRTILLGATSYGIALTQ